MQTHQTSLSKQVCLIELSVRQIAERWSVPETCLKTVIIIIHSIWTYYTFHLEVQQHKNNNFLLYSKSRTS